MIDHYNEPGLFELWHDYGPLVGFLRVSRGSARDMLHDVRALNMIDGPRVFIVRKAAA